MIFFGRCDDRINLRGHGYFLWSLKHAVGVIDEISHHVIECALFFDAFGARVNAEDVWSKYDTQRLMNERISGKLFPTIDNSLRAETPHTP